MKKKSYELARVLLILLIAISLVGCGSSLKKDDASSNAKQASFAITDQKGRQISFDKTADKIVSLSPANTEILFALGLNERIIGVTQYCNYPEQAKEKTVIGTITDPNIEKIVSLQPGVVFSSTMAKEPVDKLEQAGIKVVVIDPKNIDEVWQAIQLIGQVTGVESKSNELISNMKSELNTIEQKISTLSQDKRPVVYFEVWHDPIMTAGPKTFINYIIESAGGINLANDSETEWPSYSSEKIIAENPDFIVLGHNGQNTDAMLKRSGWSKVKAVQNKQIIEVDPDVFNRPGPRIVEAVKILAQKLHPELFN